jgi:hypothetical protein
MGINAISPSVTALTLPSDGVSGTDKPTKLSGKAELLRGSENRAFAEQAGAKNGVAVNADKPLVKAGGVIVQVDETGTTGTAVGLAPETDRGALLDRVAESKDARVSTESKEIAPGYTVGDYKRYKSLVRLLQATDDPNAKRELQKRLKNELDRFEKAFIQEVNYGPYGSYGHSFEVSSNASVQYIEDREQFAQARLKAEQELSEFDRDRRQRANANTTKLFEPDGTLTQFGQAVFEQKRTRADLKFGRLLKPTVDASP